MLKKLAALLLAVLFATVAFAASVDVNKANQAELESVKGIGPAISQKILDERKKAPFKDWNDMIERVKGVGEGNAAKFSASGLTVNGSSFAGAPAAKADKASAKTDAKADKAAAKTDKTAAKADAKADKAATDTKADVKSDAKAGKADAKADKAEAKADAKEEKSSKKKDKKSKDKAEAADAKASDAKPSKK